MLAQILFPVVHQLPPSDSPYVRRSPYFVEEEEKAPKQKRAYNYTPRRMTPEQQITKRLRYRGYFFDTRRNKWYVQLKFDGTRKHYGCYATEEEAKARRDEVVIGYYTDNAGSEPPALASRLD